MLTFIREAVARGDAVTVVLPSPGPILDLLREWEHSITVIYRKAQWWMGREHRGFIGILKLLHGVGQSPGWSRFIARVDPDRVYVMSTVCPAPMLGTRMARRPLVVFLSESVATNPTLLSVIPKRAIIWLVKRWAHVAVAVSQFTADQWNGADVIEPPEVFDPQNALPEIAPPRRAGQPLDVVMLATLSPEKGQLDAIRAAGIAIAEGARLRLTLYGDGDETNIQELQRVIGDSGLAGIVTYRGTTPAPIDVLTTADLSLVCSRNEAYGRITAESLLVGTPVVAYALGGTAEILGGGGGILVNPTSTDLARALLAVSSDSAQFTSLRDAAVKRREDRAQFGDARRTLDVIEDNLDPTRHRPSRPNI